MPRVAEWAPDIRFVLQKSLKVSFRENYRTRAQQSGAESEVDEPLGCGSPIGWMRELARSGCGMVFSHRGFPVNCGESRSIWMNGVIGSLKC